MTPCTIYLLEGLVRGEWRPLTVAGGQVSTARASATAFLDRSTAKMTQETIWERRLELKLKADAVRIVPRVARYGRDE